MDIKIYEIKVNNKTIATFEDKKKMEDFTKLLNCNYDVIERKETILTYQYETILILTTEMTLKTFEKIRNDIKNTIKNGKQKINIIKFDELGTKKLAYDIKGNKEGYYIDIDFEITGTDEEKTKKIAEMEKYFRLENNIIKFLTMKKEEGDL